MPPPEPSHAATEIVSRMVVGDDSRTAELFELVYDRLRGLAGKMLMSERKDHTLQPTALVHEAYLKLADANTLDWRGKARFAAIAARAMRQVLVEHARGKKRLKRGGEGGWEKITLQGVLADEQVSQLDLIALDDALTKFAEEYPRPAQAIELRFFASMSLPEIADVLETSERTVGTDLAIAKAWLSREMQAGDDD